MREIHRDPKVDAGHGLSALCNNNVIVHVVLADSCSEAASFHLQKHIQVYSSKANAVAGNLLILQFLVLPHLHRERGSCSVSEHFWTETVNGAAMIYQWWSVTKYNYFVTVLKYIFQVSVLYWSSFILSNFYFYFTTFQSIRSYFLLHYIS